MKINIKTEDFKESELPKITKASECLRLVLSHPEFWERCSKIPYFELAGERSDWVRKSNDEIIEHIKSGSETLRPEVDNEVDIDLRIFNPSWRSRNVVGRTWTDVIWQEINRKFFNLYDFIKIAGNMFHEWLHKMGFHHDFRSTKMRKFSVCYRFQKEFLKFAYELYSMEASEVIEVKKKISFWSKVWRIVTFRW